MSTEPKSEPNDAGPKSEHGVAGLSVDRLNDAELSDEARGIALSETVRQLFDQCVSRSLTIACAESLSGGLLLSELISVEGASSVVRGGIVAYDSSIKNSVLNVPGEFLSPDGHGVVSEETAIAMAREVRDLFRVSGKPADIGIATTGVAGPDSLGGRPVGDVYIAIDFCGKIFRKFFQFSGDRNIIRQETVRKAIVFARNISKV